MERVLKNIFKANKIKNFENEDYSEHLEYFKEAVLEDRLDFNSTMMLQILGGYFLAYWKLIHTKNKKIELIINKFLESNDWTDLWKLKKPTNLSKMEEFYWDIKTISSFRKERISNLIPQTNKYLIEKKTYPRRRLNKS